MKQEFAMLAHSYSPSKSFTPIGWCCSRKLNGWGCVWDGGITRGMLASDVPWYYSGGDYRLKEPVISTGLWTIGRADKNGIRPKTIQAPDWFLDLLPVGQTAQGEIWKGDDLSGIKSICGCSTAERKNDPRWRDVEYRIYNVKPFSCWGVSNSWLDWRFKLLGLDTKLLPISNKPWYMRMAEFRTSCPDIPSWEDKNFYSSQVKLEPQHKIKSNAHLNELYERALDCKHEGLMLIDPNSFYETSRSYSLLKYKPKFDAEATLIGYEDGKTGINIGRLGALICKLTWDEKVLSFTGGNSSFVGQTVEFKVSGMSSEEREWSVATKKWPVGSTVHFTFGGVTNYGVPFSCNVE